MAVPESLCIGIAGGTASGKTTLADALARRIGGDVARFELDWYYRDLSHLDSASRAAHNFDHPDALEWEHLEHDAARLAAGQAIDAPVYDFKTHLRTSETKRVQPAPVLLAEGLHCLHSKRLRELFTFAVYISLDAESRLARRIRRDVNERGRAEAAVRRQFTTHAQPMHEQYVAPMKRVADVVVAGLDIKAAAERVMKMTQEKTR